jgi:tetratricopeptide (TPR) repeat protein
VKIHPSDLLIEEMLVSASEGSGMLLRHLATCRYCRSRLERLPTHLAATLLTAAPELAGGGEWRGASSLICAYSSPRSGPLDRPRSHDYSQVMERSERTYLERAHALEGERRQAVAFLDELVAHQPSTRALLLANSPRFHTWGVYESLLERSWQLRGTAPTEAHELARLALELSNHLSTDYYSVELIEDLRARAWSYIGNLRRIASDLDSSEKAFQLSYLHLKRGTCEPFERAMFLDLKASLRRAQRRFGEAIGLLKRAVSIFLRQGDQHRAGKSLVSLSLVHDYAGEPGEAITVLQEALRQIDPSQDERLLMSAWHNLIWYHCSLSRYIEAQGLYRKARPLYTKYEAAGFGNLRLWAKGKIELGLGQSDSAEELFLSARTGFLKQGIPYEAAMVSMDLAILYAEQCRSSELKQLAAEMLPIFSSLRIQREALAALMFLKQALDAERLTTEAVTRVASFLQRAKRDPSLKFEAPSA